jgi:type VI secretion system protein ImpF
MSTYLLNRERLRPFLLDRLVDDDATLRRAVTPSAPPSGANVREPLRPQDKSLSAWQYRQSVLRDLQWLLNSQALPAVEQIEDFPEVAASVLNYGLPDLSSRMLSGISDRELEQMITRAIERFEPRILPHTLRVRVVGSNTDGRPGAIEVEIQAEVWALPMPESVHLRTEIDFGLGACVVKGR